MTAVGLSLSFLNVSKRRALCSALYRNLHKSSKNLAQVQLRARNFSLTLHYHSTFSGTLNSSNILPREYGARSRSLAFFGRLESRSRIRLRMCRNTICRYSRCRHSFLYLRTWCRGNIDAFIDRKLWSRPLPSEKQCLSPRLEDREPDEIQHYDQQCPGCATGGPVGRGPPAVLVGWQEVNEGRGATSRRFEPREFAPAPLAVFTLPGPKNPAPEPRPVAPPQPSPFDFSQPTPLTEPALRAPEPIGFAPIQPDYAAASARPPTVPPPVPTGIAATQTGFTPLVGEAERRTNAETLLRELSTTKGWNTGLQERLTQLWALRKVKGMERADFDEETREEASQYLRERHENAHITLHGETPCPPPQG